MLGISGIAYDQANFLGPEPERLDRMPLFERPLAVPQRKVRDTPTSLADETEGTLRVSQCAPQIMNQLRCFRISDSHERRTVAPETCHRIEHHVERGKAKRFLRSKQGFFHRIPQPVRSAAQRDAHMQHPGRAWNDTAGRRKFAAQPQLSLGDFRKLFRIRIQGEEARNECWKAGHSDLARLQCVGKEIAHFSHMFLRGFQFCPSSSRWSSTADAPSSCVLGKLSEDFAVLSP